MGLDSALLLDYWPTESQISDIPVQGVLEEGARESGAGRNNPGLISE